MKYVPPGRPGSIVSVKARYENFIGGKWIEPTVGKYRTDLSPATAAPITEVAESIAGGRRAGARCRARRPGRVG